MSTARQDTELVHRPRLLVVDDEPALARMIQQMLADDFDVDVVTDGRQALNRLDDGPEYHAILCDIMMPGMTGMELHALAAAKRPAIEQRFIFMTGGAFADTAVRFLDKVRNRQLSKPFDMKTLLETVAGVAAEAT